MESNTLLEMVIYFVVTFGVGGFSVMFLNQLYAVEQFAQWTDGWKRAFAMVLAVAAVTILWAFGLYMGYFTMPLSDGRAWVEAWFAIVLPSATVQQIVQGFTKPDQGQANS